MTKPISPAKETCDPLPTYTQSLSPDEKDRRSTGSSPSSTQDLDPAAEAHRQTLDDPSDRYQWISVHAKGGLGRIIKANDHRLGRTVAIKELLHRSESSEKRFLREALITARLEHPSIVPVHDAGRFRSGEPYYSMKLVSGQTLKDSLANRSELTSRLALLPQIIAVTEAIAYAHSQGVLHRDIKPSNIVLGEFGETVVVDWGLAKYLDDRPEQEAALSPFENLAKDQSHVPERPKELVEEHIANPATPREARQTTMFGHAVGTPAYMSPEQAKGEPVDATADVFSLGALLYEVLTGKPPYSGDTSEQVLRQAIAGDFRDVEIAAPSAPADLVAIVRKATAVDKLKRYLTAKELADDLKRFQTGQVVSARSYSSRQLMARWFRRNRAVLAIATVALLALVVVGVVSIGRVVQERNLAEDARDLAQNAQNAAVARSQDLVFLQAQASLGKDPTAAIAWLKDYPQNGPHFAKIAGILDMAQSFGVAKHVLRTSGWLHGVGFLPDKKTVVAAGRTGEIWMWNSATGQGGLWAGHKAGVMSLAVSPTQPLFATGGVDGSVALWNAQSSQPHDPSFAIPKHESEVEWLQFAAAGKWICSGSADRLQVSTLEGEVVWSQQIQKGSALACRENLGFVLFGRSNGEIVRMEPGKAAIPVLSLASGISKITLSGDGNFAAVQTMNGGVNLVNLKTKEEESLSLKTKTDFPWIEFSPNSQKVALGGQDGSIIVAATDDLDDLTVLRGHEDAIYQLVFSSSGDRLYSASDDGTVRVWNLSSNGVHILRGHEDDVYRIAGSADDRLLASASLDGTVRIWPLSFDASQTLQESGAAPIEMWSSSQGIHVLDAGHFLSTWNMDQNARIEKIDLGNEESDLRGMATSQNSRYVGYAYENRAPELLDRETGELLASRELFEPFIGNTKLGYVKFSDDSQNLLVINTKGTVKVLQLSTHEIFTPAIVGTPRLGTFSPNSKHFIVAGDNFLSLWDLKTRREISRLDISSFALIPRDVVFSKDGTWIAIAPKIGQFVVWRPNDNLYKHFDLGGHWAMKMAFSPDNKFLAAGLTDRTIHVWEIANGKSQTLAGHSDLVMRVEFTPNGATLVSSSYDKTIRLWSTDHWQSRVLRGHQASVDSFVISPDSKTLFSASRDGAIKRWDLSALPSIEPAIVAQRLNDLTSATIDEKGRVSTPTQKL